MNTDSHIHEDIPAYLANELTEAERLRIDLHLSQCSECSRELEDQKKLDSMLAQARNISPRPELLRGVMNQVQSPNKTVPFRKKFIIPLLAAAAVIIFVLFLLKSQKDVAPPPESVKKAPIIKPQIEKQPQPNLEPEQSKPDTAPLVTKKEKKLSPSVQPEAQIPQEPIPQEPVPELSPEEADVVAQLDELEDMDIISNYENLENMELALIGEGNESRQ